MWHEVSFWLYYILVKRCIKNTCHSCNIVYPELFLLIPNKRAAVFFSQHFFLHFVTDINGLWVLEWTSDSSFQYLHSYQHTAKHPAKAQWGISWNCPLYFIACRTLMHTAVIYYTSLQNVNGRCIERIWKFIVHSQLPTRHWHSWCCCDLVRNCLILCKSCLAPRLLFIGITYNWMWSWLQP